MNTLEYIDLGLIPYKQALLLQEETREKRILKQISDRLILLEHPPVFTLGKRDCNEDIITSEDAIKKDGIDIVKTSRGGRVTYHGPGQLVGYFIISLEEFGMGIKDFVGFIENVCINTLKSFGISSGRDPEHPGIWVGKNKIAAIGLNVSHNVTMHGFALNVNCDMAPYRHIIACGIKDKGVTSMKLLGKDASVSDVKRKFVEVVQSCHSRAFSQRLIRLRRSHGNPPVKTGS